MTPEDFGLIVEDQMQRCEDVLGTKAMEYAPDEDRLHNFRTAAVVSGVNMRQALAGMMVKHTISLYDMCAAREENEIGIWTEKITDHINYLLLLKAIVIEEGDTRIVALKKELARNA